MSDAKVVGVAALEPAASWLLGGEVPLDSPASHELQALLSSQAAGALFSTGVGKLSSTPAMLPACTDLTFAIKSSHDTNAAAEVQLGRLSATPLGDLLQLIQDVYLPSLCTQGGWPEQLKQQLISNLHCFLAILTDCVSSQLGQTMLYVPADQPAVRAGSLAQDHTRLQLLESLLLQWTRQIHALVDRGVHDGLMRTDGGPLAELSYWQQRKANLENVRQQLQAPQLVANLQVLEAASTPSLPTFLSLAQQIDREAERAQSNALFLTALELPCKKLAAATPAQVPALLPKILHMARLVWTLSPHYNTPDLLTSLLRRVSSAVIERCHSTLDLAAIFSGSDLDGALAKLQTCKSTAASWRELYTEAVERVSQALPDRPWSFSLPAIFAHLDAFVQRCCDLEEVCAAQKQFACELEVERVLAGPHAAEVGAAVAEVRSRFARHMESLQSLGYDVLDVHTTAWYADFAAFKAAARDLEVMLGNVLATGFEAAATLAGQLDVLCAFAAVATRDGLRKSIEQKTSEWHTLFLAELNAVKGMFETVKNQLPIGVVLPSQAGRAAAARALLCRTERTWASLQNVAACLPAVPLAAESAAVYEAVHSGLQQYVHTINGQWYAGVDRDLKAHMANSLLMQDKAAGGLLAVNLQAELALVLEEGDAFEAMRLGVPGVASELLPQRQHLRALHTCLVQQVVRPYNAILDSLSREERRLFRDRLRYLDRRVLPGVNKLSWSSPKHQTDFYCKDASRFCKEIAGAVADLKQTDAVVSEACAQLRGALLLRIDKKRVYSLDEFGEQQAMHQAAMRAQLEAASSRLRTSLSSLYHHFAGDSEEVQQEWLRHLQRADAQVLEAVAVMVRRSLHELARALQGERKSAEVPPLFVLSLVLDNSTGRVELSPTFQHLFDTVHGVSTAAVALVECLPRLPGSVLAGCAERGLLPACLHDLPATPPYVEQAGKSEDAIAKQMQAGISSIIEKVQALLLYFEKKYRSIWENEKEAYLRRYERANKPPAAFLADIERFRELSDQVLGEDSSATMRWLRLDCTALKQTLVASCEAWASKFAQLLASLARRQLEALQQVLHEPAAALEDAASTPSSLAELHARLQGEGAELEGKIAQCQERYKALATLELAMLPEEVSGLKELSALWEGWAAALEALQQRAAELQALGVSVGGAAPGDADGRDLWG